MTAAATAPVLHMPEEPTVWAERWLSAILDGAALDDVVAGDDGVADWLWSRWRILASAGDSRRPGPGRHGLPARIWLWLAGERTWAQCCSGLIGRITRRPGVKRRGVSPATPAPLGVPVLELGGVTVCRDGVPVLAGVDWRLCGGERWVILGPNGSGKTTLLGVAGGAALAQRRDRGDPRISAWGRVDVRTLRPRVALVSGAVTRQLRADVTAREVVASGRHGALETWWNTYTSADWKKADQLCGARWSGRTGRAIVRRDLGGRAPTGPPGPGLDGRS